MTNQLIGRITIDDVVDVIRDEAEHSVMSMAGLDEEEDVVLARWICELHLDIYMPYQRRISGQYQWAFLLTNADNGRITIDDVVDVIRDEAEHSVMSMAGLDEEEDVFAPVMQSSKRRSIWLNVKFNLIYCLNLV
jgi:Mg/Co/Ni transporter MgtE